MNLLGVILCGGKSTRMGTDKGLLKLHADTWAQTAADKIVSLNLPVVLSINNDQYPAYSSVFPASQLITDDASLGVHGPLCGLLSVHLVHPTIDLLILGCDLPLMESQVLTELVDHYRQKKESDNDAFVFTNDGEPEPLCGIYRARGLAHIISLNQRHELLKHSMKFMLEHVKTYLIPLADQHKKCFRNFNAHAELNGL